MLICVCVSGAFHLSWGFLFPRMYMYCIDAGAGGKFRFGDHLLQRYRGIHRHFCLQHAPRGVSRVSLFFFFNSGSYWEKKAQIQIFSFCLFIFPMFVSNLANVRSSLSSMHFTRCLIPNLSATMSTRWRRSATPTWYITLLFEIDFLVMFWNQPSLIQFSLFCGVLNIQVVSGLPHRNGRITICNKHVRTYNHFEEHSLFSDEKSLTHTI